MLKPPLRELILPLVIKWREVETLDDSKRYSDVRFCQIGRAHV
jgi:hypothetical protein